MYVSNNGHVTNIYHFVFADVVQLVCLLKCQATFVRCLASACTFDYIVSDLVRGVVFGRGLGLDPGRVQAASHICLTLYKSDLVISCVLHTKYQLLHKTNNSTQRRVSPGTHNCIIQQCPRTSCRSHYGHICVRRSMYDSVHKTLGP